MANEPSIQELIMSLQLDKASDLLVVFFLLFVNWGIEARKWQISMRSVEQLNIRQAFIGVFSGTTLAFFTPNRIGEYLGRMVHIEKGKRISTVPATLVCSVSQLMITVTSGCIALFLFREKLLSTFGGHAHFNYWLILTLFMTAVLALLLTIFYFRARVLAKLLERMPIIRKWKKEAGVLEAFNATILWRLLSLSGARFIVFIAQYYLLFRVFEVHIDWWQAFWSLSLVFLVVAMVPGMGVLTELGIRWSSGLHVLQMFSGNVGGIFAASLMIWIVNMVIPALIGGILLLRPKAFNRT